VVEHRLHLRSGPADVWRLLATDDGRVLFWAEQSTERDGVVRLVFPNGLVEELEVLVTEPPRRLVVSYFGERTELALEPDGSGGTDLHLRAEAAGPGAAETSAGWVSVLMALKAAADFGVDLRNHDPARTWDQRFVDN
jgi:uncharacterized protein YndB with AHSA1/START domain